MTELTSPSPRRGRFVISGAASHRLVRRGWQGLTTFLQKWGYRGVRHLVVRKQFGGARRPRARAWGVGRRLTLQPPHCFDCCYCFSALLLLALGEGGEGGEDAFARDAFHSFTDTLFGLLYQKSGGRGRNAPTRGVCRALRVITRSRKFWIHDSHGRAGKVLARSLGGVWGIFAKIRGRVVRVRVQATLGLSSRFTSRV